MEEDKCVIKPILTLGECAFKTGEGSIVYLVRNILSLPLEIALRPIPSMMEGQCPSPTSELGKREEGDLSIIFQLSLN